MPYSGPSVAVAATAPRRSIWGEGGDPRLVNPGDPPRDPRGEFRDVYRNLMHPLFPARRAWSGTEHLIWVGFAGLVGVATLGGAPALYALSLRKRRKRYDHLFRYGLSTIGTILSIPEVITMYAMVKYEFEAGGVLYRGFMQQPGEMARYWSDSDRVSVLYDAADPSSSCIIYR